MDRAGASIAVDRGRMDDETISGPVVLCCVVLVYLRLFLSPRVRLLWVLMEDTRKMGGNAIGEIRWIPRNPSRTTADPTCRKKWGWVLIWPLLATPAFQSARVEAVAYNVPDTGTAEAGLYLIPENASERAALVRRVVNDTSCSR
jgi:hypothetical protein